MNPVSSANRDANQKLVDQYTEIARLAGGLAHEIKNPLSTISLNMELLAEDFADPQTPQQRRALTKIQAVQRECRRLQDLLDGFLSFAKVRRPKLASINLNQVVRQVLSFFQPKAQQSRIEVVDYLATDLPTVLLDAEAFYGALLNLVLNAQQAMPNGGQLVVRTSPTPDGVALDLIDTAAGWTKTRGRRFSRRSSPPSPAVRAWDSLLPARSSRPMAVRFPSRASWAAAPSLRSSFRPPPASLPRQPVVSCRKKARLKAGMPAAS